MERMDSGLGEDDLQTRVPVPPRVECAGRYGNIYCKFDPITGEYLSTTREVAVKAGFFQKLGVVAGTIKDVDVACPPNLDDRCESCPNSSICEEVEDVGGRMDPEQLANMEHLDVTLRYWS